MTLTREDLELRKSGIGGSEVAACLGLSKWSNPSQVWARKVGEAPDDVDIGLPGEIGHYMEPKIAEIYQRRNGGREVCPLGGPYPSMRHPDRPWHIYSPDRIVLNKGERATPGVLPKREQISRVLEIKTAGKWTRDSWGEPGTDQIPYDYLCQVAWYMSALDVDSTDVAVIFSGSQYERYHVTRDHELESHLLEQVEKFWIDHIVAKKPPSPDGSSTFSQYLRDRWDKTIEKIVPANDETDELAAKLKELKAHQVRVKKDLELTEQLLKVRIADYDGIDTGEGRITWKFDSRGRVGHKEACEALGIKLGMTPGDFQAFMENYRGKPSRKFVTPRKWSKDQ